LIVVDTSVWIDFFRDADAPHVDLLALLVERNAAIALTDVVFAELLQGAADAVAARTLESRLRGFDVLRLSEIDDFRRAAELYRRARSSGHVIRSLVDCLIASVCIREDASILHNDADFDRLASCTPLEVAAVAGR
jgi:predicted nucleic acid-binding protein